jgi:hypothetical protein
MSVDLSRVTEDRSKHYTRVIFEQGRPHVDADLNEQQHIAEFRDNTEAVDVIGQSGAPKEGGGFKIATIVTMLSHDLSISAGRMYADGVLAELSPTWVTANVLSATQAQVPNQVVDGIVWAVGQYVEVAQPGQLYQITNIDFATGRVLTIFPATGGPGNLTGQQVRIRRLSTLGLQPDLPSGVVPPQSGRYRAYLDVWEQQITWIQDPEMREIALGGVDTAGRAKVRAQVRLERAGENIGELKPEICSQLFGPGWMPQGSAMTGLMAARIDPGSANQGDCVLPPLPGYQGLESQLYRIQVDKGGDTATDHPTFKWQRDNGSIVTAIETYSSSTATVHDTGRDDVLGFQDNDLVEVSDDTSDLANLPFPLQTITHVDTANRKITLGTAYPAVDTKRHAKIQRWDGQGSIDPTTPWITIEWGLQVQFAPGTYRSGDFWLIPARTATGSDPGTIEWAQDDAGNAVLRQADGIKHRYAPIGVADWDGEEFTGAMDCRALFPPLTDIHASDVKFDDSICKLPNVTNVQEAIDALCERSGGICTLTASPGPNWQLIFNQVANGTDARVCFPVGNYPLEAAFVIADKGHLLLEGSGFGTQIQSNGEGALIFERCSSVQIRDLWSAAAQVKTGKVPPAGGLNGVLTFVDCPDVFVERVSAGTGAGTFRGASCLNLAYPTAKPAMARIRDCDLWPGHQQVGVLVTGADRVSIENCVVRAGAALQGGQGLYADPAFRHAIKKTLFQGAFIGKVAKQFAVREAMAAAPSRAAAAPGRGIQHGVTTPVSIGNLTITLKAPGALASAWPALIQSQQPQVASPNQLLKFVNATADRLMADSAFRASNKIFNDWLTTIANNLPPTASQGIVVAGPKTGVVRIVNCSVTNAMEGIHVGLSAGEGKGGARLVTGPVLISGNTVNVYLSPDATRSRHGIFVGNNSSLVVENNYVSIARSQSNAAPIDGIRVWGAMGRLMVVRQNHVVGATVGARIVPMPPQPASPHWIVGDNLLEGGLVAATPVISTVPAVGTALNAS